jgi:DNA-binding transcriptional LysR family regulator
MINPTLRHLRCFVAVAHEGTFTLAAKRVFLTQPALTAIIRQLELSVGLKLFDRTTRRVSLTREGASFLPIAERLIRDFDAAIADVRATAQCRRGQVGITASPSVAVLILAPVVRKFSAVYENVRVSISDGGAESVQRRVLRSESDFGVASKWADDPELEFTPLLRDSFGVVCREDYALSGRDSRLTWRCLRSERYIGLAAETGVHATLHSTQKVMPNIPSPHYEVSSTTSLHALLDAGLGVSVLPALSAKLPPLNQLAFRALAQPRIHREICIITRRNRALSPAAQSMLDMMAEHLRSATLPAEVQLAI